MLARAPVGDTGPNGTGTLVGRDESPTYGSTPHPGGDVSGQRQRRFRARSPRQCCACGSTSEHSGSQRLVGVGGNGATESGPGAGGIYANGVAVDTLAIARDGDRISISCNSANVDRGTHVVGATIVATPVQKVVVNH
jgi:hypothetical protein